MQIHLTLARFCTKSSDVHLQLISSKCFWLLSTNQSFEKLSCTSCHCRGEPPAPRCVCAGQERATKLKSQLRFAELRDILHVSIRYLVPGKLLLVPLGIEIPRTSPRFTYPVWPLFEWSLHGASEASGGHTRQGQGLTADSPVQRDDSHLPHGWVSQLGPCATKRKNFTPLTGKRYQQTWFPAQWIRYAGATPTVVQGVNGFFWKYFLAVMSHFTLNVKIFFHS